MSRVGQKNEKNKIGWVKKSKNSKSVAGQGGMGSYHTFIPSFPC